MAAAIQSCFQRLQLTPDSWPADLIGTLIYNPRTGEFTTKLGPIFSNLILADEINRAPAKVQSALLEAMQERQVTIGEKTYPLSDPFLVLATQNPIEQEGTYQLPEAQLDRFMFKLNICYPQKSEERNILDLMATSSPDLRVNPVVDPKQIIAARDVVNSIYIDDRVKDYIVDVVWATREPAAYNLRLEGLIRYGASPRATIYLALGARAHRVYKAAFVNKIDEALGEAYETQSGLDDAVDSGYLSRKAFEEVDRRYDAIGGMLSRMIDRADDFCKHAPGTDYRSFVREE